jgi:hypothetical protein
MFNEKATAEKGSAVVKLKVTEELHIVVTKVLVDTELNPEITELELVSGIYSDDSG